MPTRVTRGVIIAVPVAERFTQLEFASRFTMEEQVALEIITETHSDPEVRATLRVVEKNLLRATEISHEDPRTQLGVAVCVDALVAAGVIASSNREQRIAEVLAPKA